MANRSHEFDINFIRKVYEIVAEIPAGKVATYGQIALMAGDAKAAQEVGHIMSRAPSGHIQHHFDY